MRRSLWIAAFTLALLMCKRATSAEPCCCPPSQESFFKRFSPAGGWRPYGLGMFHWWPCRCFPCAGAPDDYCRKPLPPVCWPPYPSYYISPPSSNLPTQCNIGERR